MLMVVSLVESVTVYLSMLNVQLVSFSRALRAKDSTSHQLTVGKRFVATWHPSTLSVSPKRAGSAVMTRISLPVLLPRHACGRQAPAENFDSHTGPVLLSY